MNPSQILSIILTSAMKKQFWFKIQSRLFFAFGCHVLKVSLIWNRFSLSWLWHFWRVQDIYFSKVPQFDFGISSWLDSDCKFLAGKAQKWCESHLLRWLRHVLSAIVLVMSHWRSLGQHGITWLEFLHHKVTISPLSVGILWRDTLRLCKHLISHEGITQYI